MKRNMLTTLNALLLAPLAAFSASLAYPPPRTEAERAKLEQELSVRPTPEQIAWQKMGVAGWIHFVPGSGETEGLSAKTFNPAHLDCRQWVRMFKAAGGGLVLLTTQQGHEYCHWNTRTTTNNISNTPWKNGQGDLVRDLSEACRAEGIKVGLYLTCASGPKNLYGNGSPAVESIIPTPDANRPFPAGHRTFACKVDDWNRCKLNQIYELITEYGPIAEIWIDAPQVNVHQPYNIALWDQMIHELSPDTAVLGFGNCVKKVRQKPCFDPRDGQNTMMPGWLYASRLEYNIPKVHEMMERFLARAARGTIFSPNASPNSEGVISDYQIQSLAGFGRLLRQTFGNQACSLWDDGKPNPLNRATDAPPALLDNNPATIWEPSTPGPWTVEFRAKDKANLVLFEEDISLAPRVTNFCVEQKDGTTWKTLASNIKNDGMYPRCILKIPEVPAGTTLRLSITGSRAKPRIEELGLFYLEPAVPEPVIHRRADGRVAIEGAAGTKVHYTSDGSLPTANSPLYADAFDLPHGGLVQAVAVKGEEISDIVIFAVSIPKTKWKIQSVSSEEKDAPASAVLDEDIGTVWRSQPVKDKNAFHFIEIDLGETTVATAFSYLAWQNDAKLKETANGMYEVYLSDDPLKYGRPIVNSMLSPVKTQQIIRFATPASGRYLRVAFPAVPNRQPMSVIAASDIGLLGK